MRRLPLARFLFAGLLLLVYLPEHGSAVRAAEGSTLSQLAVSLDRADRYVGSRDPELVQERYEIARRVEGALNGRVPSSKCRAAFRALARLAHAHVLSTEAYDQQLPELEQRLDRQLPIARRLLNGALGSCTGRTWAQPIGRYAGLLEPLEGEAFFGAVRARLPGDASRVEARWNGRLVLQRPQGKVVGGVAHIALDRVPPGPGTLEIRFYDGEKLQAVQEARQLWLLPPSAIRTPAAERRDHVLAGRLGAIAAGFNGFSAVWTHDFSSGRTAGWNNQARFPAASTVKLGVLAAALKLAGARPERSRLAHDLRSMSTWSSNLAANRLLRLLGGGNTERGKAKVEATLRQMGATRSTYTGEYRVGTSGHTSSSPAGTEPPLVSARTTTAEDLGRILASLHSAATGKPAARRRAQLSRHQARVGLALLLNSVARGDNLGPLRPSIPSEVPVASKQGWISSARHSATIIYTDRGPLVLVLLTYREALPTVDTERLGKRVLAAVLRA